MKIVNRDINIEELRNDFQYKNGQLIWKNCKNPLFNGRVAGYKLDTGYIVITYKRFPILAHRLVWLYKFGKWPKDQLDHINRDKSDNRIENLREVTNIQNCQNKSVYRHNSVGSRVSGVSFCAYKQKYKATIVVNGKYIHGGFYHTLEEAEIRADELRNNLYSHYISPL